MLFLLYSYFLIFLILCFSIYPLLLLIKNELVEGKNLDLRFLLGAIGWLMSLIFFFILSKFIKYHIELICENKTTIDILDEKRGNFKDYNYNMGRDWNFSNIFGKKKLCWPIPLTCWGGEPIEDGTVFVKTFNKEIEMVNNEEELSLNVSNEIQN